MTVLRYLRDAWVTLLIFALALVFCALLMVAFKVDVFVMVLVLATLVVAVAGALTYDFLRRRRFYDALKAACEGMDRKQLVMEVLEPPQFLEGELAYDVLKAAFKSMNDEIATYRRSSEDYRDYIETWVHEVKTPIAAAELVADGERTPAMRQVNTQLARIDGYVEQALYYARSTTLERDYLIAQVSLDKLVRDTLRANARTLIDAQVQPTLGNLDLTVFTDAKWCAFILGQLMSNTAKYRKPDGPAQLSFEACTQDAGTANERTVLRVGDNGIGVPATDVVRVFDRGFTGQNGRTFGKSTGMGLYLCKRLCDKMGISISLESEQGQGTTVSLGFPCNRLYLV